MVPVIGLKTAAPSKIDEMVNRAWVENRTLENVNLTNSIND